jgi:hypothetical protein
MEPWIHQLLKKGIWSWDLRCDIREKLIAYIQTNHPQSLPELRASVDPMRAVTLSKA